MRLSAAQLFHEIGTSRPPSGMRVVMRRAVVLGGSIAGLLAARVLSDHADEVIVVERDASDADGGPRAGVPQGSQVHALLPAGAVQLERWFPGFADDAIAGGAVVPRKDGSSDRFFMDGQVRIAPPVEQDWPVLITTRPYLEAEVRRRTLAVDNIRFVTGRADGLLFDGERVVGVKYVPEGATEAVTATGDFVVDAMGRSSRLGDWVEAAGWERPPMRRMPIKLNYATAMFAYDEAISDLWSVIAQSSPGNGRRARIGGVLRVEGDRWIMLIAGYDDDRPSRDAADFVARCRNDFPAVFGDIAGQGRMLGDVVTYHQADSRRRDFHQVSRLPAGLAAAGDAIASFNPVYGQGMTSAALHASCLSTYLRSGPDLGEPAKAYFDRVAVVVDAAWQVSTFADLGLPHVHGPYPRGYRLIRWVSGQVFKASMTDGVTNERLTGVTTMLAHPNQLARPGTILRALRLNLLAAARR
ncbi:FAD-dependent oxidoreductase [Saccharothrix sp. NRRL B-16314]|uniref:FAD-dependent oxidoreductase n=1 Tax=Saccharothrix sp. NRRL B-16314 TaxID=1463825 RepID=UPI00068C18B6|nr:FAD-dependent monooxygenase [Saccharothrix sp. NRRL B-16314]